MLGLKAQHEATDWTGDWDPRSIDAARAEYGIGELMFPYPKETSSDLQGKTAQAAHTSGYGSSIRIGLPCTLHLEQIPLNLIEVLPSGGIQIN